MFGKRLPKFAGFVRFWLIFYYRFRVIFNRIKREYNTVNLGQGFPDFAAPEHVRQALAEAVTGEGHIENNQYTREFVSGNGGKDD